MGAGGSVESSEQARLAAEEATRDQLQSAAKAVESAGETLTEEGAAKAAEGMQDSKASVEAALSDIPDDQKAEVMDIFNKVKDNLTPEQISAAASDIKESLEGVDVEAGHSVLIVVSSSLTTAAACAPEVMAIIGEGLLGVAEHLPYIGVAAGVLGAIVHTFKASKENDKNVECVMLWSASIKDWLILVAGRVSESGAKSTAPLFQGLQDAIGEMVVLIEQNRGRSRISKMLNTGNFTRIFEQAKSRVLELKNALRDYLDQEMQDAQEAKLKEITAATIETNEKLDCMNDQMAEIKAMLIAQAEANAESAAAKANMSGDTDTGTEDALFGSIQEATGCIGGDVPFKKFCMAFETFMLKGADLPSEVKRGLKIAVDKENENAVSKLAFTKFFRQWQASELSMDDFLLKLADEAPPTLFASLSAAPSFASNFAAAQSAGIFSKLKLGDATALASQKAAEARAAASNMAASAMGSMGGMFGKK